ncbi:MAG: hypothetical protein LBF27_04865 [Sphingobacterium sp.]|jgi:hypothetical protein|nr:hypothetical protein [Sphingobacterium sp.]
MKIKRNHNIQKEKLFDGPEINNNSFVVNMDFGLFTLEVPYKWQQVKQNGIDIEERKSYFREYPEKE